MYTVVLVIHIIVCIFLVLSVLLQQGKGAEIGAVFGSSDTLFGPTGPITFLNKLTTIVAVIFMVTSLTLTYLSAHRGGTGSIMKGVTVPTTTPSGPIAPAEPTPGTKTVPPVVPKDDTAKTAPSPAGVTDAAKAKESALAAPATEKAKAAQQQTQDAEKQVNASEADNAASDKKTK